MFSHAGSREPHNKANAKFSSRQRAKRRDVIICDVFVTDWSNLIFNIHDHADPT